MAGKVARVRAKKVMLTAQNKQKRLKFALEYQKKSMSWWRKVTFTDSKYFQIGAAGRVYQWLDKGDRPLPVPKPPRGGPRVHVYIGLNHTSVSQPIILRKEDMNVNADLYIDKVLPKLVRFSRCSLGSNHIFMQDGASAHSARKTLRWLQRCPSLTQFLAKGTWPPQSADLNVVENLWSYLAAKVQEHQPRTEKALAAAVQAECKKVTRSLCLKLISSMPTRLADVVQCGGAPIQY